MRTLLFGAALLVLTLSVAGAAWAAKGEKGEEQKKEEPAAGQSVLDFKVKDIDGNEVKLGDKYAGKVILLVNVASKCGLTPQYTDLESAYEKYKDKGFVVLGFPSNDFKEQEPGTEKEIKEFCTTKYNVQFPLFSKVKVKGEEKEPLYKYLTDSTVNPTTGGEIPWNFTKFLVGRDGKLITRFNPPVKPSDEQVTKAIESALQAEAPKAQ
jgi:glutathione peroxidase